MDKIRFTNQSTDDVSGEIEIIQEPKGALRVMNNRQSAINVIQKSKAVTARSHSTKYHSQYEKEEVSSENETIQSSYDDNSSLTDETEVDYTSEEEQQESTERTPSKQIDDSFKEFINMSKRRPRTQTMTPKSEDKVPTLPPKQGKNRKAKTPQSIPDDATSYEDEMSGSDEGSISLVGKDDDHKLTDIKKNHINTVNVMNHHENNPYQYGSPHAGEGVPHTQMPSSTGYLSRGPQGHGLSPSSQQKKDMGAATGTIIMNPIEDPKNTPGDGYASIEEEKIDLLFKLDRMRKKDYKIRSLDDSSCITDIRKEYNRVKSELELEHSISFSRKILMAVVSTIEFLNKKYDPFDLALNGWSESVMENINSYDNVLERLYYKYRTKVAMPPELELMITLAGSAFMFHMTNSLFKSMTASLGAGQSGTGRNPDLLQSMMSAFANIAQKTAPPSQPPPPPPPPPATSPSANHTDNQHPRSHPQSQPQPSFQQSVTQLPSQSHAMPSMQTFENTNSSKQYKMKGPDMDINTVLGGNSAPVTNMIPNLMNMLGGLGTASTNVNTASIPNVSMFVNPNPISSSSIPLPRRAIEVEDERFNVATQNASINAPFQTIFNNQQSQGTNPSTQSNNTIPNDTRPIFPEPPLVIEEPSRSPEIIEETHQATQPQQMTTQTPAFVDADRLSDIITDDLESIRTDVLDSVVSDDEGDLKTVPIKLNGSTRKRQPMISNPRQSARSSSRQGSTESKGTKGTKRGSTKTGGRILVL